MSQSVPLCLIYLFVAVSDFVWGIFLRLPLDHYLDLLYLFRLYSSSHDIEVEPRHEGTLLMLIKSGMYQIL